MRGNLMFFRLYFLFSFIQVATVWLLCLSFITDGTSYCLLSEGPTNTFVRNTTSLFAYFLCLKLLIASYITTNCCYFFSDNYDWFQFVTYWTVELWPCMTVPDLPWPMLTCAASSSLSLSLSPRSHAGSRNVIFNDYISWLRVTSDLWPCLTSSDLKRPFVTWVDFSRAQLPLASLSRWLEGRDFNS